MFSLGNYSLGKRLGRFASLGHVISRIGFYLAPRRLLSLFLVLVLFLNGPFGVLVSAQAQIISDPRAPIQFQPRVGAAPNGVPLVDVTKPSFGGLSHNKFDQYNVDTRGVILNNSGLAGTSILGGQIPANPNLVGSRPASVILNEVTGTKASLLNGPTEVFGAKAEVIVANPNGVTCRSCSFINTGRVTLATGVPVPDYQNGTVGFNTTRGVVRIEEGGVASIDAEGKVGRIGDLDLVGRQIVVDAPINSSGHLRLRAGAINWNQNSDIASRLTGADIAAVTGPAIASTAAGVIQAGTISVLSYDLDLGIALNGDMAAFGVNKVVTDSEGKPVKDENGKEKTIQTSSLVAITSAGDLSVGSVGSNRGDIRLEADGTLTLLKDNQAMGRITGFGQNIRVEKDARLLANDAIVLEAVQDLVSKGYLQSGAAISVVGGGNVDASGTIIASGMIDLEGNNVNTQDLKMSGATITVAGLSAVALENTILVAKDTLSVLGYDMRLGQGTAFQAGENNSGTIFVDARGTFTNATILNYPNLTLNLGKTLINEASGQIVFDDLRYVLSDKIINAGLLYGRLSTWLEAQSLDNRDTGIIYGPEVTVSVTQAMINAGKVIADGKLSLTASGAPNSQIINNGQIQGGALTQVSTTTFVNQEKGSLYGAEVTITVSQDLVNSGKVLSENRLSLFAKGASETRIINSGLLQGQGLTKLEASNLNNQVGGTIYGAEVRVSVLNNLINGGKLISEGNISISASGAAVKSIANNGLIYGGGTLALQAEQLTNVVDGTLYGAEVLLTVTNDFFNAGKVVSEGRLIASVSGTETSKIINAGLIQAKGSVELITQALDNQSGGTIYGSDVTILLTQGLNNSGKLLSEGDLYLDLTLKREAPSALSNTGAIQANGTLTLRSASYSAGSANAVLTAAKADIIVSGAFETTGRMQIEDSLSLKAESLKVHAGAKVAAYDATFILTGNVENAGAIEALNLLNLSAVNFVNSGSLVAYEISRLNGSELAAGLTLSGGLTNSGTLQAVNNFLLNAADFYNTSGAALQAKALSAIIGNGLVNNGTILSDSVLILQAANLFNSGTDAYTATISGKNLEATIAGHIENGAYGVLQATQSSTISAQTANLDLVHANDLSAGIFNYGKDLALTLTNQGLTIDAGRSLIADGSLYLSLGGDITVYGTLASRNDLSLHSGGSITIGRNDPNNPGGGEIFTLGNAEIIAAGDVSNYASVIQSLGSMYIKVGGTLTNTRTAQRVWTSARNPSDYVYLYSPHPSEADEYTDNHTYYAETSQSAQIWADGNMVIEAGAVRNDASTIYAGNDLTIRASTVYNLTRDTGDFVRTVKTADGNQGLIVFSGWFPGTEHLETGAAIVAGGDFVSTGVTFIGDGLLEATVIRIDAETLVNGITDPNRVTAPSRLPDPVIDLSKYFDRPDAYNGGSQSSENYNGVRYDSSKSKPVIINGIKYLNSAPLQGDSQSRGPGWILEQVGDVREGVVFFADPTTEMRAITQASLEETGKAYLDPSYRTPKEQQEALWQATVDFLKSNPDIKLGDALTKDQRARLTQPILWYVSQNINGETVLVPQLLLPENRLEEWRKSNGGVMAADDIYLSGDSIHNTGALLAENKLSITADTFTNERRVANTGHIMGSMQHGIQEGGFIAGELVQIKTTGDLINIGGTIIGDSALNLVAGGNLVLTASVVENEFHDGSKDHSIDFYQRINYGGTLYSGGDMSLYAGNDMRVEGTAIMAQGDASLLAGGNISISSVVDETSIQQAGRSGNFLRRTNWHSSDETTTNVSSLVMAGGNLTVAAAGNVDIHASDLVAGNDMLVAAGAGKDGDPNASVTITAGQDSESHTYSKTKSGVLGGGGGWLDFWYKKNTTTETATLTNVGSSLSAGGDITITAKNDINIQGSQISAGGTAALDAGHDISITPGYDGTSDYFKKSHKGVGIGVSAGNGSAQIQQGYHSSKTETTLKTQSVVPSVIQGGNGVVMKAGNDINLQAAIISSPGDITLSAGHDINDDVAYNTSEMTARHSEKFFGVTTKVSENVTGAIDQLKQSAKTFKSGHGSTAYEVIGMASGIMQATDGLMSITNPTVSASIMLGGNGKQTSLYETGAQAVPSQLLAGGNLILDAGNNIHLRGTQAVSGGDMILAAGNDITIESAQSYATSGSKEQSWSVGIGLGMSVGVRSGSAGIRVEGDYATSESENWAVLQNNARLAAGGSLLIFSGHDTTIAGAVINASDISLVVGNDLIIESRQDRTHTEGNSFSLGGSLQMGAGATGSLNVGGGKSESNKSWVSEQTGLYADGKLDISVGNHTQINGAVINSKTGDLTLDTGTLGFSDILDSDKGNSTQVNLGISNDASTGKPTGVTVSGNVANWDREQVNRATIGEGTIIIRNEEEQQQDVATLNRDLDKAQEITKDESSGVDFYVSSSAIQEIASGFETTRENVQNLAKVDQRIPQNIRTAVDESIKSLNLIGKTVEQAINLITGDLLNKGELTPKEAAEVQKLANEAAKDPKKAKELADKVASCASQQGFNFNILDLFVTPAHAEAGAGTLTGGGQCKIAQVAKSIAGRVAGGVAAIFEGVTTTSMAVVGTLAAVFVVAMTGPAGGEYVQKTFTAEDGTIFVFKGDSTGKTTIEITTPNGDAIKLNGSFSTINSGTVTGTDGSTRQLTSEELRAFGTNAGLTVNTSNSGGNSGTSNNTQSGTGDPCLTSPDFCDLGDNGKTNWNDPNNVDMNKINHLFGKEEHNLNNYLYEYNNNTVSAYQDLYKATQQTVTKQGINGIFEVNVSIGKHTITVRGIVVNGVTKIGTAFIP